MGVLAEEQRRIYFEYDPDFLRTGLQLSPFKLPAHPGLIEHRDRAFGPLPGLFDDSLPDGWGLLLMDRHFRRQGLDPSTASPLDRLAFLGTRTMGALTYHPADVLEPCEHTVDLDELSRNAEEVFAGDAAEVLPQLLRAGGSPGGARPKVLVGVCDEQIISGEDSLPDGFEPWIVKFASRADAADAGPLEHAYALMAAAAGIDMPEVRLFETPGGRRYFAVRRFDRGSGHRRVHVHTFANLIHVDFRIPSTDYTDLFKATRALTRNHQDLLRLFRRMVFNIAAHVRDDHAKNFAFLLNDEREWSLAPAYDLTFASGSGGEHTMTVAGEGRTPAREHCLMVAAQSGIRERDVEPIIERVNEAVARWRELAERSGCSGRATSRIAKAVRRI